MLYTFDRIKYYYYRFKKSIFWESLKRPYSYCLKRSLNTFLWAMFTIFGGLLGFFINLVQRCVFGNFTIYESIYIDSKAGYFYMYALVLISAILGPLFLRLVDAEPPHFRKQKMVLLSISIFVMIFNAIFYSAQVKDIEFENIDDIVLTIDVWQTLFFVMSLFLAFYALGIEYIDKNPDAHKDLDTYSSQEESEVEELKDKTAKTSVDGIPLE